MNRLKFRRLMVGLLALATLLLSEQLVAAGNWVLGQQIAGTYLRVSDRGAIMLQIDLDGNFTIMDSGQFSGGVLDGLYSDTLGSWQRNGLREIIATTVNLTYARDDGAFIGVGAFDYVITFDAAFQTALLTCEGAIFAPGVDPFAPGAQPIAGSEYVCDPLEFQRLPIGANQ